MKTLAFFNNKGGVGQTSLVYHLAWMFAEHDVPVLAVDLDPQASLTAMFLPEESLADLWPDAEDHPATVYGAIRPLLRGLGDLALPRVERILPNLGLLPGDLGLSRFEDPLADAWPRCLNADAAAFRTLTAFHRLLKNLAADWAELVLIDTGPNLGALNRSVLIAADSVCLPLAPDLASLQGLRNVGPSLRQWRDAWQDIATKAPAGLPLPAGSMNPLGYVVMQPGRPAGRPVQAHGRWLERIPPTYRASVLNENPPHHVPTVAEDAACLAQLRHSRSLMPLALEARKPMFHLKPADGALGSHAEAVRDSYQDFLGLARRLAEALKIRMNCEG